MGTQAQEHSIGGEVTRTRIVGLEPVATPRPRFSASRRSAYYPRGYADYKRKLRALFRQTLQPTLRPVHVTIAFVTTYDKRIDNDNVAKGILDALCEAGIIVDDNVDRVPRLSVYGTRGDVPEIEVVLIPLTPKIDA